MKRLNNQSPKKLHNRLSASLNSLNAQGKNVAAEAFNSAAPLKTVLALAISTLMLPVFAQVTEQSTSYTYTTEGQVDEIDGPRTDVSDITDHNYDPTTHFLNQIIYSKNDVNLIYQFLNHDARGNPQTTVDPNGVQTELGYHPRGWLETTTVKHPNNSSLDATTTSQYDAVGQVTCSTTPEGRKTLYTYNGARYLEQIIAGANDCDPTVNSAGSLKKYGFNLAGDITTETIYDGLTDTAPVTYQSVTEYDELSRTMNVIGNNGQHSHFDYDANDFLTKQTDVVDASGTTRETEFTPDELDRLDVTEDAYNNTTDISYDDQGNLHTVTDARGNTTTYNYDAFGNVENLTSPDTGYQQYVYDAANNLTFVTDGRQVQKSMTYDGLNRITSITYPGNTAENVTYYYDNYPADAYTDPAEASSYTAGRLTGVDGQYANIRYYYDHRGNVTKQKNVLPSGTYSTEYTYWLDGQINTITYPNGVQVAYAYNATGQVHYVTATYQAAGESSPQTHVIIENVLYMPFGPARILEYGNGVKVVQDWNLDYQLETVQVTDGAGTLIKDRLYTYSPAGNIEGISDAVAEQRDYSFQYDLLDRLTYDDTLSNDPNSPTYQYDEVGNRTVFSSQLEWDTIVKSYGVTYQTTSNRMDTITYANNPPVQVLYDDAGNIEQRSRQYTTTNGNSLDAIDTFIYNDEGRLINADVVKTYYSNGSAINTSSQSAQYQYNPLGQRITKVVDTGNNAGFENTFNYNLSGQTLHTVQTASVNGSVNQQTEKLWVYVNGTPIAQLSTSDTPLTGVQADQFTLTTYYTNHLGVAEAGFNANGDQVWQMDLSAFGEQVQVTHLGGVDEQRIDNPLRFPGQYWDGETGLFYNYYRDYDPSLGRYIQSDPIGLGGGINTYGYTEGNPLKSTDEDGLITGDTTEKAWCRQNPKACKDLLKPNKKKKPKDKNRSCSVYYIYAQCSGELVYIGMTYTDRANKRFWEHKKTDAGVIKKYTCKQCPLRAVKMHYHPNRTSCANDETYSIRLHKPVFNKTDNPDWETNRQNWEKNAQDWRDRNCKEECDTGDSKNP